MITKKNFSERTTFIRNSLLAWGKSIRQKWIVSDKVKIGLALGGGGARGLSHLGVLKVLEEEGIRIDLLAGVSMGAIVGGGYVLNPNAEVLKTKILQALKKIDMPRIEKASLPKIFKGKTTIYRKFSALVKEIYALNKQRMQGFIIDFSLVEESIEDWLGGKTFAQTKIPFYAICTDLNSGEEVVLHDGRLDRAVLASSSIPAIFPPLQINGRLLSDGGAIESVPVRILKELGADVIIAVNLETELKKRDFSKGMNAFYQVCDIRGKILNKRQMEFADIIIEPATKNISWAHFSKAEKCIQSGEEETRKKIAEIKAVIEKKKLKSFSLFQKNRFNA